MMLRNWASAVTTSASLPTYADQIGTVLSAHCTWKAISTATKSILVQRDSDWATKDLAFVDGWADATDSWMTGSTIYVNIVYDQMGNHDASPTNFAPLFTSINDHGLVQLDITRYCPQTSTWWAKSTSFIFGFIIERPTTTSDTYYNALISLDADAWSILYNPVADGYYVSNNPYISTKGSGYQVIVGRAGANQKLTVSNNDLSDITANSFSDDTISIASGVTRIGRFYWGGLITAKFAGVIFIDGTSDDIYNALLTYLKTKLLDLQ